MITAHAYPEMYVAATRPAIEMMVENGQKRTNNLVDKLLKAIFRALNQTLTEHAAWALQLTHAEAQEILTVLHAQENFDEAVTKARAFVKHNKPTVLGTLESEVYLTMVNFLDLVDNIIVAADETEVDETSDDYIAFWESMALKAEQEPGRIHGFDNIIKMIHGL